MSHLEILPFNLPTKEGEKRVLGGLNSTSITIALADIVKKSDSLVVAVVPSFLEADRIERELKYFIPKDEIIHFPDWETLPYDNFSPHQDIISDRIDALYRLGLHKTGILLIPVATLMHKLCPIEHVLNNTFSLKVKDLIDQVEFREKLVSRGYRIVNQVMEHGEAAIRGSIIDIFPMGAKLPFRIDLFDNEVDSIRSFDPNTQKSIENVQIIKLNPAKEFPISSEAITKFRSNFRDKFEGDPTKCSIYVDISDGLLFPGIEYYLPLFFDKLSLIFDFLPNNSLLVNINDINTSADEFYESVKSRYQQYSHDISRPILPVDELFISPNDLLNQFKPFRKIELLFDEITKRAGRENAKISKLPNVGINVKLDDSLQFIRQFINNFNGKILLCGESTGRKEIILDLFKSSSISLNQVKSFKEFIESNSKVNLATFTFEQGIILDDLNIAIISENDLFGRKALQTRRKSKRAKDFDSSIRNLAELNINDFVVHLEHGVGIYKGLVHIDIGEQDNEFVLIEYAGNDKLYVPVTNLDLISRYSGVNNQNVKIHRLGGDVWQKEKRKTQEKAYDVAAELLDIYARRKAKSGYAYMQPDAMYESFASEFPFEETIDQINAINDVISDLTSDKPMDRVICGDVGFGKTEVAMRACFVAVYSKKQVAVLVPTTLLAQQHYDTFSDRFANFSINVEVLSRFRTKNEQDKVIERLKEGKVDIIIGTHKLLQDDIKFKNLGLLIIDEEHRFGVRQKEKFKSLRSEVDILTMTATPIPRTLNMAMNKIRDLSIIATPPPRRLSVKTFVREYNKPLIVEAILRELARGGQVYFLHNNVETIENRVQELASEIPQARITSAHGQMRESELERIMADFYHRRFNVLVCTTIIETGIDIPTANTIIIERADKLGLAQLHQLRGRVGRSHHQAYAFLLSPPNNLITSDAKKRLEAIGSVDTLGAGFSLATHDMEIRGAGELLGQEQSGNIQAVGFALYSEILEQAVKQLQAHQNSSEKLKIDFDAPIDIGPNLELQIPALIPEDYLPDVHIRLVLYKRISGAKTNDELDEIKVEMIDRFGLLPIQVSNLFKVTSMKLLCNKIGINKLKMGSYGGKVSFKDKIDIDPMVLINLVRDNQDIYQFDGATGLKFKYTMPEAKDKLNFLDKFFEKLSKQGQPINETN